MTTEQAFEISNQISKNIDNGNETAIIDMDNNKYHKHGSYLSTDEIEMTFPENTELVIWNNDNVINKVIEGLTEIDIFEIDMQKLKKSKLK